MKTLTIREIRELITEVEFLLQSVEKLLIETHKQLKEIQRPRTVILKTERDNADD